ncbi:hypothetical protein PAL_GLEAN10004015 [Pteropus alecto]|uniref:Uncharacterized protein n=1 Tax=Pteropus alecto TaxID=9402 RepID=L5KQ04_PTEAL|nr:hypothetical protein PAL_GLEAN10004015 [Pteropus alecto]
MHQHYAIHFAKGTLPPQTPSESYFLEPELGHQKGCCHQWFHVPTTPQAHGHCQPPPQARWQLAYHSHWRGAGGCCWGPQTPILQQLWPQPPPPSSLRQRLCPVQDAQKGPSTTISAPMGLASVPKLPPAPTRAPAMASSGPAPLSTAGTLLEPSRPTAARPLPAPAACGPFTSYSSGAHPAFLGALSLLPRFPPGPGADPPPSLWSLSGRVLVPDPEPRAAISASSAGIQGFRARAAHGASIAGWPGAWAQLSPCADPLALLSVSPALPPLAQRAMEDIGQGC